MAGETNQTTIRVLKNVPLDSSYTDTIKFASASAQSSFFLGKQKYAFENCTYQRVNNSVAQPRIAYSCRVPQVADNLYDCNYIMFQNSGFGNKWFYCFIKQVNYVNPNNTEIIYEIDDYQTWAFDFEVLPSIVEREHSLTDEPFENLEPEPIEPTLMVQSQFKSLYLPKDFQLGTEPYIVATFAPLRIGDKIVKVGTFGNVGGIYSGCGYAGNYLSAWADFEAFIDTLNENGDIDSVVNIFMTPVRPEPGAPHAPVEWNTNFNKVVDSFNIGNESYTIRNKKLLSYPFSYFKIRTTTGKENILRPELCMLDTLRGWMFFCTLPDPAFALVPSYDNMIYNHPNGIIYDETVQCTWYKDTYANWMAQNQTAIAMKTAGSMIGNVINTVGSVATSKTASGAIGSILSGVGNIAGTGLDVAATIERAKQQPNIGVGGNYSAILNMANGMCGFEAYRYVPDIESCQVIDDFFDMFGYATNKLKVPNMEGRESWNYVKTNNVIIKGSLPVDAMNRIKAMFNNGIRFWHGDFVGDYSRSNRPLSEVKENV